jgi:hypothetical protein
MSFAGISLEALPLSTFGFLNISIVIKAANLLAIVALITALSAAELAGFLASAVKCLFPPVTGLLWLCIYNFTAVFI